MLDFVLSNTHFIMYLNFNTNYTYKKTHALNNVTQKEFYVY